MARQSAAAKQDPEATPASTPNASAPSSTELTLRPSSDDALVLAALAEAGIGDDDNDGLSEFSANDFRTPALLYNLKGRTTADGAKVTQDLFYDSIERTAAREIDFVLLDIHMSNAYQRFDNKEQRNLTICSSFDRKTGVMADGRERPCKGCPDAVWKTDPTDGKRRANCSEVWSAFCFDLTTHKVFLLRFKKTSLDSIRNYTQQYHYGKREKSSGGRASIPLFVYRVHAHLEMDKTGNFAVPVLTRGAMFSSADMRVLKETAAGVRETLSQRLHSAEASIDSVEATGGGDASFDTEAYDAQAEVEGRGSKKFSGEE